MRLGRLLRHRWLDETDARRALGAGALDRIAARIRQSEGRHAGEIRVCVEAGLPLSYLRRDATARERAVALFGKLRVWDTEGNNGVLIYLLLADRAIEVVADRGIARKVDPAAWSGIVGVLQEHFRTGRYEAGVLQAVEAVEAILVAHAPVEAGSPPRPNELPDRPVLL